MSESEASSSTPTVEPPSQEPSYKVYKPSESALITPPPLPDDYFTPTSSDLKSAQSQLAARTQNLTNAPLRLKASREAEEQAKRDRWPNTTIRVRFTDRTQLEKVFPSTSKIRSVYAFVRELLREDVKPIKFILYQPPRQDLKVSDPKVRDLTLAQLHLAPSSVLLLRFEDESLNHATVPAPLIGSVMQQAVDLPKPPPIEDQVPPPSDNSKDSKLLLSSSGTGEKKIPKWLKLGKK